MQNTLNIRYHFQTPSPLFTCQSRRKQICLSETLRNIDPASSTFTFETQAVFHLAGVVTIGFVVTGKVRVKIGDGVDAGIKIDQKEGQNISFI